MRIKRRLWNYNCSRRFIIGIVAWINKMQNMIGNKGNLSNYVFIFVPITYVIPNPFNGMHHLSNRTRPYTTAADSIQQRQTPYNSIRPHTTALDPIQQHQTPYNSTRRHTTAPDSIQQRQTPYNSIRPHTTALDPIQQHQTPYNSTRRHTTAPDAIQQRQTPYNSTRPDTNVGQPGTGRQNRTIVWTSTRHK